MAESARWGDAAGEGDAAAHAAGELMDELLAGVGQVNHLEGGGDAVAQFFVSDLMHDGGRAKTQAELFFDARHEFGRNGKFATALAQ